VAIPSAIITDNHQLAPDRDEETRFEEQFGFDWLFLGCCHETVIDLAEQTSLQEFYLQQRKYVMYQLKV